MGSNAIIVYSLKDNDAWRVENHYFHFDPHAGVYKVGGIDFYWSDGVSSGALSQPKKDGYVRMSVLGAFIWIELHQLVELTVGKGQDIKTVEHSFLVFLSDNGFLVQCLLN